MNRVAMNAGHLFLALFLCLGLTACNSEDFFEKESVLESAMPDPSAKVPGDGGATGGSDGGSTTGGSDGGSTGGSTGGSNGGTVHQPVAEIFKQQAQARKLDIMWVIDDSGSMNTAQENLARNFDAFIQDFLRNDSDFKMGITTTDVSSSTRKGRLVPGSELLNSVEAKKDEQAFINRFKQLVQVGTRGSGQEKGLEATEGFMDKHALSYLRKDAYLAVVILSDEEDQSPKTPKEYVDYLRSFKDEAGLVKVYSIVDVKKTRTGSGITTGFERYAEASSLTAGKVEDIYGNFYKTMAEIGDDLIELLDSFALAHEPVDGSLKVYVNNVLVTNYTYNSASRSIRFNAGSVPPVGAEIKVTYMKK
jgi:hypothetical protein